MIKTAIFDFDGTLADTIPLCREAFRRAVPIRILAAGWAAEADVKGLEERKPDYLLTRFEDLDRFFREHDGNEGL